MKIISWNTNGLRAALNKGFLDFFQVENADVFCIQETKMQPEQLTIEFPGYFCYMSSAEKKGYSGTMVLTKTLPINVTYGINGKYNDEGRAITLEFADFYLVNVYSPNSQEELKRLAYRLVYEQHLQEYLVQLDAHKPVILTGDLNVAHQEMDLKNPQSNRKNAGFSDEERAAFGQLLQMGFTDTFRWLYPSEIQYTWWSYRFNARANNAGWRIDYFVVSNRLQARIADSVIYQQVEGSDHCPVGLVLK